MITPAPDIKPHLELWYSPRRATGCAAPANNGNRVEHHFVEPSLSVDGGQIGNDPNPEQMGRMLAHISSQRILNSKLWDAAVCGDTDEVTKQLNQGADPKFNDFDARGSTEKRFLMGNITGFSPQPEIIRALLEAGADPNAKTKDGVTALHYAASKGEFEIVKILLEFGADPNVIDDFGLSVLHDAMNSSEQIVKVLLKAGANRNPVSAIPLDKDETLTANAQKELDAKLFTKRDDYNYRSLKSLLRVGANINALFSRFDHLGDPFDNTLLYLRSGASFYN